MTTRVWRLWIAGFLVLLCGGGTAAQQVSMDPARQIIGRVVDATTNDSLAGVLVELSGVALNGDPLPALGTRRQFTTAQGRFAFTLLPSGRFTVTARVAGNLPAPNGFIQNSSGFPIGAYLDGGYGQQRAGGSVRPIVLSGADASFDAQIRMWKSAVIAGVVADDLAEPLVDVVVGAARVSSDGRLLNGPTTRTDDLGRYRLSGLEPGRYVVFVPQVQTVTPMSTVTTALERLKELQGKALVGAVPAQLMGIQVDNAVVATSASGYIAGTQVPRFDRNARFAFPTTFFPAARSLSAAGAVEVGAGEERGGVDVSLAPVPTAPLRGTVMAGGVPANGMTVHVVPAGGGDASLFEVATGSTDSRGEFSFPLMPHGTYSVVVQGAPAPAIAPPANGVQHTAGVAGGPGAWLNEPVTVDAGGVSGLMLSLRSGLSLKGRLEFVGSAAPPDERTLRAARVAVTRARPMFRVPDPSATGAVDATGAFAAVGFSPGRYVVRPTSTQIGGWRLQSVLVGGREVADQPVELSEDMSGVVVTFTDRPASLSVKATGTAADDSVAVVVFPAERALWPDARQMALRVRSAIPSPSGEVTWANMLPGDYLTVAIPEAWLGQFPDATLLNKLSTVATSVRIAAGERPSLTLTVQKVQ